MLTHHFKTAFRAAKRDPLPFWVNFLGFTIGIAVFLLVAMFARVELRYDRWVPDHEMVYRIESTQTRPGMAPERTQTAPAALAPGLLSELAELKALARVFGGQVTFKNGDLSLDAKVLFADASFVEIFEPKVLSGDARKALKSPSEIVLTRSEALRLLGRVDAVGRRVTGPLGELVVGAVIEDWPNESHLAVRSLLALDSPLFADREKFLTDWGSNGGALYAKLRNSMDEPVAERRLNEILQRVAPRAYGIGDAQTGFPPFYVIHLRRLGDLYLWGRGPGLSGRAGNPTLIGALLGAALFVLIVAVANYTNLATAAALRRIREIRIRRALGASRGRLMLNFIGEAVGVAMLCTIAGMTLALLLQRPFQLLVGQPALRWDAPFILSLVVILPIVAGTLGGWYPALIASRSVQGVVEADAGTHLALKALSVAQFAVSIFLIAVAASVGLQTQHLMTRPLGIDAESVVVYWNADDVGIRGRLESLVREVGKLPSVTGVATSQMAPGDGNTYSVSVSSRQPGSQTRSMRVLNVSPEFFDVLKIRTVAGRVLDRQRADDVTSDVQRPFAIVVNETGAAALGFANPQAAIQSVVRQAHGGGGGWRTAVVVGVVNDFRFDQGDRPVEPLMLLHDPGLVSRLLIRMDRASPEMLQRIDSVWRQFAPSVEPDRDLLAQHLNSAFDTYRRQTLAATMAAAISLVLAASGLYCFGALAIARRSKEIAIRRSLGATQASIHRLLIWQFTKPALIASAVAWPLAYLSISRWLTGFHDRITGLQLILPAATTLLAAITALLILHSTRRVVAAPPADALRAE
jgi:putative ABC transport system permease protein